MSQERNDQNATHQYRTSQDVEAQAKAVVDALTPYFARTNLHPISRNTAEHAVRDAALDGVIVLPDTRDEFEKALDSGEVYFTNDRNEQYHVQMAPSGDFHIRRVGNHGGGYGVWSHRRVLKNLRSGTWKMIDKPRKHDVVINAFKLAELEEQAEAWSKVFRQLSDSNLIEWKWTSSAQEAVCKAIRNLAEKARKYDELHREVVDGVEVTNLFSSARFEPCAPPRRNQPCKVNFTFDTANLVDSIKDELQKLHAHAAENVPLSHQRLWDALTPRLSAESVAKRMHDLWRLTDGRHTRTWDELTPEVRESGLQCATAAISALTEALTNALAEIAAEDAARDAQAEFDFEDDTPRNRLLDMIEDLVPENARGVVASFGYEVGPYGSDGAGRVARRYMHMVQSTEVEYVGDAPGAVTITTYPLY